MSEARTIYRTPVQNAALAPAVGGDPQSRRVVASTARKDRNGRIVRQNWHLEAFRANPVLLANHSQAEFPIGQADVFLGRHNGADALFAELSFDLEQPLGATVAGLWDRGLMRAVSVGWTPVAEPVVHFDEEGFFDFVEFPENELAELSVVSVPANPDALAVASALKLERGALESIFTDLSDELLEAAAENGRKTSPSNGRRVASRRRQNRMILDRARMPRLGYGRGPR